MTASGWVNVGLITLGCIAAMGAAGGCTQMQAPAAPEHERLPIRRVVLYQNGVGYFERAGTVEGNQLTLQVKPSQINDLLKSLTVIDEGSGRVVSVSLPLEQGGERTLEELPQQVRKAGGLLDVLRLFRGARVELEDVGGALISGRVIGVENLQVGAGESVPADWRVSLKVDGGKVSALSVSEVRSVLLLDRTLSVGLDRSLDVSLGEGGWKPIGLSIRLAGDSPHRLVASYIVEMPRWKPAYRLVLEPEGAPLLQGWAVVDNVSGEEWRDVQLSLVSGSPISFRYNLHAPQYAERVDKTPVGLPRAAAPPPSEMPGYQQTMAGEEGARKAPREATRSRKKMKSSRRRLESLKVPQEWDDEEVTLAPSSQRVFTSAVLEEQGGQVAGVSAGALFRYDISDPLTISDRSSTLVNLVNQRVEGEPVAYFMPELSSGSAETHPYRAVKLVNGTGLMLERGPITVYSAGTFVGEGFVERLPQGATSFLTFAIDAKMTLDQHGGMREEAYRLLRISNGQLVAEAQRVRTRTYEVKSRRQSAMRAYIRTPREGNWSLESPPTGTVETPDARIVRLDVPAGGTASLSLSWKQPVRRTVAIDTSSAADLLRVYLGSGAAPPAIAQALRKVLKLQEQTADLVAEQRRLKRQHRDVSADQSRVRENLKVLRKTKGNAGLQRELSRKLAQQEQELGKLSGKRVRLSERLAELRAQLKVLMTSVTLEVKKG